MNVTFAWQVYNNYDDVLYTSEIVENLNKENKFFKDLFQISQGGFEIPPSKLQSKYLNKHFNIDIESNNELVKKFKKHIGILRLVKGYKNAFIYANKKKSDFLIISNADSCILDLKPLYNILKSNKMSECCIGIRKGFIGGISFNSGSFVPFYDDHFLIFNIEECNKYKVFDYLELNFWENTLIDFFGIHYFIKCFLDERVPPGKVYEYTNLQDTVNHYGENCGSSLLPIQFQKKLKILHANTTHNKKIDRLRAAYFKLYKFDRYKEISNYVQKFENNYEIFINKKYKFPFFKVKIKEKIKIILYVHIYKIYNYLRIILFYKKNQYKINNDIYDYDPIKYYKLVSHIYPINISGREE
tara:strand:- start:373 stop:1443 length:1071 start_codon:yes stop_codon:yes gene_type:complete